MRRQRVLVSASGFALMAGIMVGVTPAADAAPADVTCLGTTQISYSPGLHLQTQTVQFDETDLYGPCTSSAPAITSGVGEIGGELPASCLTPLLAGTFPYTLTWNTGETSQFLLTVANTVAGGVTTSIASGNVTAGEFQGDTVKAVLTYVQPDLLQCASTQGLTQQAGTLTLVING